MRSKLSYVPAACLAAALLFAAAACSSNNANSNAANVGASNAAGATQSNAAGQPAGQTVAASNAAGAASPATGAASSTGAGASSAGASQIADPCALLTSDDIKAVQGEAVKESKPSRHDDAGLRVAQCFYTTPTFNKSVSLEVTSSADGRGARRLWDERFARAREEAGKSGREKGERERERDKAKPDARGGEEEEEGLPPTPVKGLGDEAYWASSRVNGTLYARKGDAFVRVSVGGADADAVRLRKARALAQKALARL